jgi:HD-like signal output (HDOD) protein
MEDIDRPFPNANELLARVVDICPFPAAAQRLMVLVNDDRASIDAIAGAVQCDPALTTQVLGMANSAAFRPAGSGPTRDLRQALVTLGLEELRVMAGAMALLSTFATRDELSLDLHRTSAISAAIADALVPVGFGVSRGLPFICGLLCEVGALACLAVDGPGYVELWRRAMKGDDGRWSTRAVLARDAAETKRYGVTTRTIGARLLRRHQLPQEISTAVEAAPRQSPGDLIVNRATAFARVMTVPIIEALRTKDTRHLPGQIAEIAETAGLGEIERGDLVRRCVTAAAEMERAAHGTRE